LAGALPLAAFVVRPGKAAPQASAARPKVAEGRVVAVAAAYETASAAIPTATTSSPPVLAQMSLATVLVARPPDVSIQAGPAAAVEARLAVPGARNWGSTDFAAREV